MQSYKNFKQKLLQDKEVKKAYDNLEPEFEIARMVIKKRTEQGITQKELARRVGTRQSAIARLESGRYNPTITFLQKIGKALDTTVKIQIL